MKKIYIIKKYVVASSPKDAWNKEKRQPPDDVFVEENSMKDHLDTLIKKNGAGFKHIKQ